MWTLPYLVKIRLQKMHLLAFLQQPWPVFCLQLLLPQHEFHIPRGVMRLAVFRIDLGEEFQLDMVGCLLSIRVAGEG